VSVSLSQVQGLRPNWLEESNARIEQDGLSSLEQSTHGTPLKVSFPRPIQTIVQSPLAPLFTRDPAEAVSLWRGRLAFCPSGD
jgi:hypothetical protein